ncbi:MAG: helix-turn-helix domain-containing protein [Defluviitaleaceae bacterium]|nr:helix-turn-helix domain-containing protein [Defluviitaleaceae bacterium]MCL2836764.1 helix-turn-helix domain-containing protein [Defluviitaleaceae bacterium]
MKLGEKLRNLLEEKEMTQKQLAANLNIAASAVSNYVQNVREPDIGMIKRIADYFNVTTDYLLDHRAGDTLDYREDELLRVFRALTKDQQDLFIEQGRLFIVHNNKKKNHPSA